MSALLRDQVIAEARRLAFHRVGIVPIEAPRRHQLYRAWLEAGHHGEMAYLASDEHVAQRQALTSLLGEARTLVVVALAYGRSDPAPDGLVRGKIARYARGEDYHLVMRDKLVALADALRATTGRAIAARPCVDSAPLLEREWAERAAIGFVAKNTMVIAPGLGSYVLLGELLLDIELEATGEPTPRPRCGDCRACLDACPTSAFVDAYLLDARRCISYLTIEQSGAIPRPLRPAIGSWVFGCDVCQEVCPFNAGAERAAAPELAARDREHAVPDLIALAERNTNQLRQFVKRTAMRRIGRAQLLRNVAVALGNSGDRRAVAALAKLLEHAAGLVRGHAAWGLGELGRAGVGGGEVKELLRARLGVEAEAEVRDEIEAAIAGMG